MSSWGYMWLLELLVLLLDLKPLQPQRHLELLELLIPLRTLPQVTLPCRQHAAWSHSFHMVLC